MKLREATSLAWTERSPPVRGCGLKLVQGSGRGTEADPSPPVRGCGLKLNVMIARDLAQVTPRAGVWIETVM